jgi:hypothetical protein
MTQTEKLKQAVQLLKELNCPEPIMQVLWLFGLTVSDDEIKLHNWIEPPVEGEVADKQLSEGRL